MGVQFQNGFSAVDGNYGFGDGCFAPDHLDPTRLPTPRSASTPTANRSRSPPLPGGARLPRPRRRSPTTPTAAPLYKFTREEDINIGNGDEFIPQVPPPACVGALHTVDVANDGSTDNYAGGRPCPTGSPCRPRRRPTTRRSSTSAARPTRASRRRRATPSWCRSPTARSIVPTFNVFTDVPLPGRFWGLLVDDLNFSSDPHQINFGEKAGMPFAPVGIYDYTNRLVYTTESDYSGLFDVLLPSTNRINCPTPSGVCAQRLPLRRQRPRRTRAASTPTTGPSSAPSRPSSRRSRASSSRPTSHPPRSASRCSCPAVRPSRCSAPSRPPCRSSSRSTSRT